MSNENSLLTEKQRKFLAASESERNEEYSKQQRSYYRRQIRERVTRGIEDFSILFESEAFDEHERRDVFNDIGSEYFGGEDVTSLTDVAEAISREGRSRIEEGIVNAIALFYLETSLHGRFKNLLSRAVNKAETHAAGEPEIPGRTIARTEFEVHSVPRVNVKSIKSRIRAGEELSDDERIFLMARLQGDAPEELEGLIESHIEPPSDDETDGGA